MKILKVVFAMVAALALLAGGVVAGLAISVSRQRLVPASPQAVVTRQQPSQPTVVTPQQPIQPTPNPAQSNPTALPQGWGSGWMMNPDYAPQGQPGWDMYGWDEDGWMMGLDSIPQGQRGWGMYDGEYDGWRGMHGWNEYGMMGGWNRSGTPNRALPQATPSADVSYHNDIQPIFNQYCTSCHGGTAGLYLDSYASLMKGGVHGEVIVSGDPNNSRLVGYVASGYMPYRGTPLSDAQIQTLVNWVLAGALDN